MILNKESKTYHIFEETELSKVVKLNQNWNENSDGTHYESIIKVQDLK